MADDVLDPQMNCLVVLEDPPTFTNIVNEWRRGGHTGHLAEEERNYGGPVTRSPAQREAFARYLVNLGHDGDLELAGQPVTLSIGLTSQAPPPPPPIPVVGPSSPLPGRGRHRSEDTGAILVTRRAYEQITGPQPVVPIPPPTDANATQIIRIEPDEVHDDPGHDGTYIP